MDISVMVGTGRPRARTERCAEADRDPSEIRRATGFFVEDLTDGAGTVAPYGEVCDEFVFGDLGAPADDLIEAIGAALA